MRCPTSRQECAPTARQSCACSCGFPRSPAEDPSPSLPSPQTKKAPAKRRFPAVQRRGWDSNPRRRNNPQTVFETAAFNRSATPPMRLKARGRPCVSPVRRSRSGGSRRPARGVGRRHRGAVDLLQGVGELRVVEGDQGLAEGGGVAGLEGPFHCWYLSPKRTTTTSARRSRVCVRTAFTPAPLWSFQNPSCSGPRMRSRRRLRRRDRSPGRGNRPEGRPPSRPQRSARASRSGSRPTDRRSKSRWCLLRLPCLHRTQAGQS